MLWERKITFFETEGQYGFWNSWLNSGLFRSRDLIMPVTDAARTAAPSHSSMDFNLFSQEKHFFFLETREMKAIFSGL